MAESCVTYVSTTPPYSITTTTAESGGYNIFSNAEVTDKGIVWSTSTTPTTGSHVGGGITSDGTLGTPFDSSMTGLTINTTYYVRAYAISSCGTVYGQQWSFRTAASTTANTNKCYTKTVTIVPGETFTIPANAEIIEYTNAENITSDCIIFE